MKNRLIFIALSLICLHYPQIKTENKTMNFKSMTTFTPNSQGKIKLFDKQTINHIYQRIQKDLLNYYQYDASPKEISDFKDIKIDKISCGSYHSFTISSRIIFKLKFRP